MSGTPGEEHHHHQKKKRVGKACDSCRIKKTKCDGKSPCSRCVADNKICAFVHKKKSKDKVHPNGYIEMLETRINILTKSLQKLMVLSEPHLPFLQEIIENAKNSSPASSPISEGNSEDECYIPINDVVSYLVSNSRDLSNATPDSDLRSPEDQEQGRSKEDYDFELRTDILKTEPRDRMGTEEQVPILSSNGPVETPMAMKTELEEPQLGNFGHSRASSSASVFSPLNQSLRGSGDGLESLTKDGFSSSSTQDSLSNPENFNVGMNPALTSDNLDVAMHTLEGVDIFPRRSNSMFINNYVPYSTSQSPVSSLSNKLESHYLEESSIHSIRRSVSHKSHQRNNSGHVHKPAYVSHSHVNSSSNSFLANNGNIFHSSSSRSILSPDTLPSEVDGYTQEDFKRINNEDYFSLASEKIRNQPPSQLVQNDLSSYLDADLLSSNPFLT